MSSRVHGSCPSSYMRVMSLEFFAFVLGRSSQQRLLLSPPVLYVCKVYV